MSVPNSRYLRQVFFSYGIGFVYILIGLTVTGGLWPAFNFSLHVSAYVYYTGMPLVSVSTCNTLLVSTKTCDMPPAGVST